MAVSIIDNSSKTCLKLTGELWLKLADGIEHGSSFSHASNGIGAAQRGMPLSISVGIHNFIRESYSLKLSIK